ncbi:universal stress protein [Halorubrum vacuolatum]|uniref:Nucleotide-binding universal stress protein, UspA family n=1 Tax=Halorubrum vacuolatum TaxID=63740 RepID=A0A238VD00_HALVU|nr:universal stress protein [Halorubrum vacuolatum]SNR32038.1 Nucleotide-binding universal stress protein, UspA family [Halorubrum vacuolatum]
MTYLVATDGSAVSDLAIEHAAVDAAKRELGLEIIHVLQPHAEIVDGELVLPGGAKAAERGERVLSEAARVAEEHAEQYGSLPSVATELRGGSPAETIAKYAVEADVERIYVGHRGKAADRDPRVGSVAKTVVDKSSVPVVIVK